MINIIVFSKNRGSQLELFIRSMKFYFKEFDEYTLNVLYTYSTDNFKKGYEKVFNIHNDKNINYVKETLPFKYHILLLLNADNPHTIFFVDDIVFKNEFTMKCKQFKLFSMNDDILALSFRLHPKLTYCYSARIRQRIPKFNSNLIFKWHGEQGDYNYPMSLDGHFFRTNEIIALSKALAYNNPNSYEAILARYPLNRLKMICFEDSIIVNNPINKVQNYNNNVHGNVTAEYLNDKFLDGYIIDFEDFKGVKNFACHQEIEINFIKDE